MGKITDGQEPGLVSNGRRLFLLGMAGTAVVLSGCGGGGGNDTVTPAPNERGRARGNSKNGAWRGCKRRAPQTLGRPT